MSDITEVNNFIRGASEQEVQQMQRELISRQKVLRAQKNLDAIATVKIGDRVRLHDLSPKYINGVQAIVVSYDGGHKFTVAPDPATTWGQAKTRLGARATVPASCLTVIS